MERLNNTSRLTFRPVIFISLVILLVLAGIAFSSKFFSKSVSAQNAAMVEPNKPKVKIPRKWSKGNFDVANLAEQLEEVAIAFSSAESSSDNKQSEWGGGSESHQGVGDGFVIYEENGQNVCRSSTAEESALMKASAQRIELSIIEPVTELTPQSNNGLQIVLRGTAQLDTFPQAKAAFLRAAARWSALIRNPITVVVDVDFGPTRFGDPWPSGVIGSAGSQELSSSDLYSNVRTKLISGASGQQEAALYDALPGSSLPTDLGNTTRMHIPSAVLRALQIIPTVADPASEPSQYGPPPSIGFNSARNYDFDPSDGVDAGKTDFEGVALHELGHILGFTSLAGYREVSSTFPVSASILDLLRFRPGITLNTFATGVRVLSSGGEHRFFDGRPEVAFSTGRPNGAGGDGNQASHWKDDALNGGQYIGLMDPTDSPGKRLTITDNDLRAFDAIGYQLASSGDTACSTVTPIAIGQTVSGQLSANDCKDSDNIYVDFYRLAGVAGQQIAINMDSSDIDTYLVLVNADGNVVDENDDSGSGTNSRIPAENGFLTLPATGNYLIVATSYEAEDIGSYTLRVAGQGGGSAPAISVQPTSLSFGSVAVGTTAERALTISNTGNSTLNVTGITSSNARFSVSATTLNIAAGNQQSVTVRFNPTASGTQTGTLSIASNAASNPTVVSLSGEGGGQSGQTEVLLTDDGTSEGGFGGDGAIYVNRLTPTTYPSRLQTVRIFFRRFNNSPDPSGGRIRLIVFSGAAGSSSPVNNPTRLVDQEITIPTVPAAGDFFDFQVSNGPIIQSGDFYVGFQNPTPTAGVGPRYDSNGTQQRRAFFSTDNGATYRGPIALQDGTVANLLIRAVVTAGASNTAATIDVQPVTLDFGKVSIGATPSMTFNVRNTGNAALNVSNITSSNSRFSANPATSFNIAAGGQQTVTVNFTPIVTGVQTGVLNLISNASNGPTTAVSLRGEGTQSQLVCPAVSNLSPTSGVAGTTISITGQNFSDVTQVKFAGNVTATPATSSPTELRVNVPAGAQTGPVSLVKAGCNDVTSQQSFTVISSNASTFIRVLASSGAPGGSVVVPVELESNGDVTALSFSLKFNTAILSNPQIVLTSEAAAAGPNPPSIDSRQLSSGKIGVTLLFLPVPGSPPKRFPQGKLKLVNVTFTVAQGASGQTGIEFDNQPTTQQVLDINNNELSASFISGVVTFAQGYEGDVSPRPQGNQRIDLQDWNQIGRFYAGVDQIQAGSEFQRADCAPKATRGDGKLDLRDWVEAGNYYISGELIGADGPSSPTNLATTSHNISDASFLSTDKRLVRLLVEASQRGGISELAIVLDSLNGEKGLSFTLNFDSSHLRFIEAMKGEQIGNAALVVNSSQTAKGQIAVAVASLPGERLIAGSSVLVKLSFAVVAGEGVEQTYLRFGDELIEQMLLGEQAETVSVNFEGATVRFYSAGEIKISTAYVKSQGHQGRVYARVPVVTKRSLIDER